MTVYVPALWDVNPFGVATAYIRGIRKVDYFHGLIDGIPMAQMHSDKAAVSAIEMINISKGFTALRIANFQRRWRLRRQIPEPPPLKKRKQAENELTFLQPPRVDTGFQPNAHIIFEPASSQSSL